MVFELESLPHPVSCEFKFYLHDFRTQAWEKESNALVYVIAYNGRRHRRRPYYIKSYLDRIKNDLNFVQGIPLEKIIVVDGGYREEPVAELWIVPEGASAPKNAPTFIPKKNRRG
jgi:hypothetical protein